MAYSFLPTDASFQRGLRRVAASQIDKALAETAGDGLPRDEAVHQVRKRCKKLRALIRLVRPCFDDHADENEVFRDAAHAVAGPRDAAAMIETFDRIVVHFEKEIDVGAFAGLRDRLVERRDAIDDTGLAECLPDVRDALREARARAEHWSLDERGFDAVEGGLRRTYRSAAENMARADKKRSGDAFHEWRKRVKDHASHARLLCRAWTPVLGAHADEALALAEDLGEHHDLVVFHDTLEASDLWAVPAAEAMRGLALSHRAVLEARVFARGARVFAERPSALVARWRAYWEA